MYLRQNFILQIVETTILRVIAPPNLLVLLRINLDLSSAIEKGGHFGAV